MRINPSKTHSRFYNPFVKNPRDRFAKALVVTAFATLLAAPAAMAAEGGAALGVVGSASVQNPSTGSGSDASGETGYGGGVTFEVGMRTGMALETGLLYFNHRFDRNTSEFFGTDVSSTFTSGYLQVPLLVRFRPIPFVNLGAGAYYSRVISSWTVSAEGFGDRTADYSKDDYGFALAAGTTVPLGDSLSLIADLRYTQSLKDADSSSNELRFNEFQALAGLRFGF